VELGVPQPAVVSDVVPEDVDAARLRGLAQPPQHLLHAPLVASRVAEEVLRGEPHGLEDGVPAVQFLAGVPPLIGLSEPPLHRRAQTREVVLREEVVGAGLHHLDRRVLPELARDHDERRLQARLPEDGECLRRPETRQPVVRDDHVPTGGGERLLHRLGRLYPFVLRLVAALLQLAQEEQGVVLGVLHDEHPKRPAAAVIPRCYQGSSPSSSRLTSPVRTA
jgi:hypothetical protein